MPDLDYWITTARLPAYKAFDPRVFWQQDNEHRILFPQFIFAADYMLWHGRRLLPLIVSFLSYFGSWLILIRAFWSAAEIPVFLRDSCVLLSAAVAGWQGSAVVLASPMGAVQWTLTQLAVLLSLVFLYKVKSTHRVKNLIITIVFAVIASYSNGNGLTVWPILIIAGLFLSLYPAEMIALVCAAALSIRLFFVGYLSIGRLNISQLVGHPIYAVEFVASYLSVPFGFVKSNQVAVCIGIISLLGMFVAVLVARRKRALQSRAAVVLLGWYCFTILTAILIASGRVLLTDPSYGNAKQSRYLLNPLLTWSALLLISAWACSQLTRRAWAGYTFTAVAAVLILEEFHQLHPWLLEQNKPFVDSQLAGLAVEMNIFDPGVMLNLFPWNPSYVEQCSPILRKDHLSVYYKGYSNWLGRRVDEFAKFTNAPVYGAITYTYPVLGGVEVGGWADDSRVFGTKHWILLSNDIGQIVGFARRLPAGFPDTLDNPETPPSLGWAGFVSLSYPVREIAAYLVTARGLLPLTHPAPAPQLTVATAHDTGAPLQEIQWQRDASWTPGEPPPTVPYGSAPAGPIYNSWSGSDANTGRILSSSFSAPGDGCLILPVLQGYHSGGLSTELIDADTNQVIARIPFQDASKQWILWRIRVSTRAKHLRIRAQDDGRNWGEWLALGTPASCRTP